MRKKIHIQFMLITAIAILCTVFFSLCVSYDMIKDQVMEEIRSYAYLLRDINVNENISWESFESIQDELRITVVEEDGSVIYDNYGNHYGIIRYRYRLLCYKV